MRDAAEHRHPKYAHTAASEPAQNYNRNSNLKQLNINNHNPLAPQLHSPWSARTASPSFTTLKSSPIAAAILKPSAPPTSTTVASKCSPAPRMALSHLWHYYLWQQIGNVKVQGPRPEWSSFSGVDGDDENNGSAIDEESSADSRKGVGVRGFGGDGLDVVVRRRVVCWKLLGLLQWVFHQLLVYHQWIQ